MDCLFYLSQGLIRLLEEGFTSSGQTHTPFGALKELDAHLLFEALDLLAQGGLSHMQLLCCPTKMQRFRNRNKILE